MSKLTVAAAIFIALQPICAIALPNDSNACNCVNNVSLSRSERIFEDNLLCAANPVKWVTRENNDLADAQVMGWQIEIPETWVAIPDVHPGWPKGAGFRTPKGKTGLVITWLSHITDSEQESLKSREYIASPLRLSGVDGTLYTKRLGPTFTQVIYIKKPSGVYRISTFGTTRDKHILEKVLKSFQLTKNISNKAKLTPLSDTQSGFSISYPESYALKKLDNGFDLLSKDKVIIQARLKPGSSTEGQSFRGYARSLGKIAIPQAKSLAKFEPYEINGVTSYQAVWETENGKYVGPIVYTPLKGQKWKVLEITLADPAKLNDYFKIVNSLIISHPVAH